MSAVFDNEESVEGEAPIVVDELVVLKERATKMNIKFHPSIGLDSLRSKVNKAVEGEKEVDEEPVTYKVAKSEQESKRERQDRLRKDAARLIRINVTCMNPNKKDHEGEILTVSNSVVGTHKKYVPFNTVEGWHVPNIIFKTLLERKCQVFQTVKGPRGEKVRRGKLIKEFSIDVLDPLTKADIEELGRKQALANNLS
jgi:hypothetical protein